MGERASEQAREGGRRNIQNVSKGKVGVRANRHIISFHQPEHQAYPKHDRIIRPWAGRRLRNTPGCQESYLFADEGAGQGNNGPEENATAQDDLSVEAVAQVAENGGRHHEAADENCKNKREEEVIFAREIKHDTCWSSSS